MIIQTDNLQKRFGRHDALKGVNFRVPEGAAYALIGPNGAGKTTTIQLLMNFISPSGGAANILGINSRDLAPEHLTQIGYVSENQEIPASISVGDYLAYLRPFYPNWDIALEAELLRQLRLPAERKVGYLSHGMRMKMALACALPFRPKLLILDEPFSGLDPLTRDELIEGLLGQAGETTIFISSHELSEIESFATHIGFLDDGHLLFQEPMESLQARLRAVRLILDRDAAKPPRVPESWLDVQVTGNVLSFVDTEYAEVDAHGRFAALVVGVQRIETQPVPLRSVFTTLVRARRDGRNA
jgi:ABC-2 type transport system ATP-binding protein